LSVHEELVAEQRAAMKAGDKATVNAIRQVQTEVSVAKASPGFDTAIEDDDLYHQVIASYVKKMEKARREYLGLGDAGKDQADKLAFEVEYLSRWVSAEDFDADAARVLVQEAIAELGVADAKQAGLVTGHVMRSTEGLDGAVVNRLVREELDGA
jgi:hypothetical protein